MFPGGSGSITLAGTNTAADKLAAGGGEAPDGAVQRFRQCTYALYYRKDVSVHCFRAMSEQQASKGKEEDWHCFLI